MILFHHFDGVLHGLDDPVHPRFARVPMLEAWLRGRPAANMVISSTWRFDGPLSDVTRPFLEDLRARFAGATPGYMQRDWIWTKQEMADLAWPMAYKRHCEVLAWLHEHGLEGAPWVALDDTHQFFAPGTPQRVACDHRTGIMLDDLEALDRVLQPS